MTREKRDSIPPLGASKWTWAAWWLSTLVTWAAYIAAAAIATHFILKYW